MSTVQGTSTVRRPDRQRFGIMAVPSCWSAGARRLARWWRRTPRARPLGRSRVLEQEPAVVPAARAGTGSRADVVRAALAAEPAHHAADEAVGAGRETVARCRSSASRTTTAPSARSSKRSSTALPPARPSGSAGRRRPGRAGRRPPAAMRPSQAERRDQRGRAGRDRLARQRAHAAIRRPLAAAAERVAAAGVGRCATGWPCGRAGQRARQDAGDAGGVGQRSAASARAGADATAARAATGAGRRCARPGQRQRDVAGAVGVQLRSGAPTIGGTEG